MPKNSSLIVLIFLLLNCSNSSDDSSNKGLLELHDSTPVELSHGDELLSNYLFKSKVLGEDSLYSFDPKSQLLTLFDLKTRSIKNNHVFSLNGPNFIEEGTIDFWVDPERIIFLGNSYISVFDHQGQLLKRIENEIIPNYRDLFIFNKFLVKNDSLAIISIDHTQGRLPNVAPKDELPIFLQLNLNSLAFNYLDVTYPEDALMADAGQGYYGKTTPVSLIQVDAELVYSFSYNSKVYAYNPDTNASRSFRVNSNLSDNDKPPLKADQYSNTMELMKFGLAGLNFGEIRYDQQARVLYRTHSMVELDGFKEKGRYAYLTAFNMSEELLADIELTEDLIPYILINKSQIMAVKKDQQEGFHSLALLSLH